MAGTSLCSNSRRFAAVGDESDDPGEIAAGTIEARYQAELDRITAH